MKQLLGIAVIFNIYLWACRSQEKIAICGTLKKASCKNCCNTEACFLNSSLPLSAHTTTEDKLEIKHRSVAMFAPRFSNAHLRTFATTGAFKVSQSGKIRAPKKDRSKSKCSGKISCFVHHNWPKEKTKEDVPLVVIPPSSKRDIKFVATLYFKFKARCSAVVISRKFAVVPCCFCTRSFYRLYLPDDLEIRFTRYTGHLMDVHVYKISTVYRHPMAMINRTYRPGHDLALVRTYNSMKFSKWQLPHLPLQELLHIEASRYVHLSSYNFFDRVRQTFHRETNGVQWQVWSKIVPNSVCLRRMKRHRFDDNLNFCVAYEHKKRPDNCLVDLGAAVSYEEFDGYTVIGLIINKRACGRPRAVAACVDLVAHLKWIQNILQEDELKYYDPVEEE